MRYKQKYTGNQMNNAGYRTCCPFNPASSMMPMMDANAIVPLSSACRKYVNTMMGSTRRSIIAFSLRFSSGAILTARGSEYLATSGSMRSRFFFALRSSISRS